MAKYTIRLDTPRRPNAGTNAHVWGRIVGERGISAWRLLDNRGDDREQGSQDYYKIDFDINFGHVSALDLAVRRGDNNNPDWFLQDAYVVSVENRDAFALYGNRWIYPPPDGSWVYPTLPTVQAGKLSPYWVPWFIW